MQPGKDITKLSVDELKVIAFDYQQEIVRLQKDYEAILQQLNNKLQDKKSNG